MLEQAPGASVSQALPGRSAVCHRSGPETGSSCPGSRRPAAARPRQHRYRDRSNSPRSACFCRCSGGCLPLPSPTRIQASAPSRARLRSGAYRYDHISTTKGMGRQGSTHLPTAHLAPSRPGESGAGQLRQARACSRSSDAPARATRWASLPCSPQEGSSSLRSKATSAIARVQRCVINSQLQANRHATNTH